MYPVNNQRQKCSNNLVLKDWSTYRCWYCFILTFPRSCSEINVCVLGDSNSVIQAQTTGMMNCGDEKLPTSISTNTQICFQVHGLRLVKGSFQLHLSLILHFSQPTMLAEWSTGSNRVWTSERKKGEGKKKVRGVRGESLWFGGDGWPSGLDNA